jgi:hypothetical protein
MSSTALELFMRQKGELERLDYMQRVLLPALLKPIEGEWHTLMEKLIWEQFSREVCARRARKLRKRGEDVRFARLTSNGKARYRWMRKGPALNIIPDDPWSGETWIQTGFSRAGVATIKLNSLTVRNSLTKTGPEGPVSL